MNALVSLYPGDDAVRVSASVAVPIAGVVLLSLAAALTVARRNAALRHGIWLAALAWVCIAPVAALGLQRAGITIWRTFGWHWPAKSASAGSSRNWHCALLGLGWRGWLEARFELHRHVDRRASRRRSPDTRGSHARRAIRAANSG